MLSFVMAVISTGVPTPRTWLHKARYFNIMLRPFSTFLFFCFLQQWFASTMEAFGSVSCSEQFLVSTNPARCHAECKLGWHAYELYRAIQYLLRQCYHQHLHFRRADLYRTRGVSDRYSCAEIRRPTQPQNVSQWAAVPLPSWAQPSHDNDAEMVVYQPSSDKMWDFYKAVNARAECGQRIGVAV